MSINIAQIIAIAGGPTTLGIILTWLLGTRGRRVDYAKVLQQMALDQSTQLDDRLEKTEARLEKAEKRVEDLTVSLEAALKRARLAEEESGLRKAALQAAGLPVPSVVA